MADRPLDLRQTNRWGWTPEGVIWTQDPGTGEWAASDGGAGGTSGILSWNDFRAMPDGDIAGMVYGTPTTFTNGDGPLDPSPTYDNGAFGNPEYQRAQVINRMFRHDLVTEGTLAAVVVAPTPGTDLSSGRLTVNYGPVYRGPDGDAVFDNLAKFTEGGAVVVSNTGTGFVMSCHYRNDGDEVQVTYNAKVNRTSGSEIVIDGTLDGETDQTGTMDLDWSTVPTGTLLELRRNGVLIGSYIDLASGGEFVDTSTLGAFTASIICQTPEFELSSQIRWIGLTPTGVTLPTLGSSTQPTEVPEAPEGGDGGLFDVQTVANETVTLTLTAARTFVLLDATLGDTTATLPLPSVAGREVTFGRYDGSVFDAFAISSGPSAQSLGRLTNSTVTWVDIGTDWVLTNNYPE